ncbi:MAG TPA: SDR family oxidoreductase [Accumulibacter sp.]|uniref:SDR family oxidoreductase n=1 Tax=Accumulibacter sp. TaxID=2053492 RepID=UPI002BCBB02D|nr:SDR family oxidoreductase [Accumulibacter sp.]HRD88732.1 SDR family oxidoreductase [Accumulibacter sp.]HRD90378.1 SDR family oxidoreductase [Accumulibacter sp.]
MILVTGANGHLGRGIVDQLVARSGRVAGIAASVRDPRRAADLAERGIAVRQGNFDQPETLAAAFAGVGKLILVSTDGPKEVRIAQHRNAIDAARAAGVRHILYTSLIDVATDSPADFAAVHRATEADLAASGLEFTALRNPLYADFLPMTVGAARATGVFQLPAGSGRACFVSRAELAEATAAAALAPALARRVYELTGQATHDYHEVAAAVARVSGQPVRYQAVSEDAYADALEASGVPGWLARSLANMYSAVAAGKFDRVSNDFATLVGHPPRPLACLAQELFGAR